MQQKPVLNFGLRLMETGESQQKTFLTTIIRGSKSKHPRKSKPQQLKGAKEKGKNKIKKVAEFLLSFHL